jgi:hypothetical protein
LRSLILLAFIATSVPASLWQRHVVSGKGESFDTTQPHPLAYFIADPFLRDDGDQFCSDCTPRGKAAEHLQRRFATELKQVGSLQGFAIYDLFYRFEDHVNTGEIDWKSILVEVAPGQFREIYHLQPTAAKVEPAFLVKPETKRFSGRAMPFLEPAPFTMKTISGFHRPDQCGSILRRLPPQRSQCSRAVWGCGKATV